MKDRPVLEAVSILNTHLNCCKYLHLLQHCRFDNVLWACLVVVVGLAISRTCDVHCICLR